MNEISHIQLSASEISALLGRICERMGIAFSANLVFPGLADLGRGQSWYDVEHLNAIGKRFGIRFRQMSGSFRDLVHVVRNSGPVLVRARDSSESENAVLIMDSPGRSQLTFYDSGGDRTMSVRRLRKELGSNQDNQYQWLLIQPLLAAQHASRFHYQSGTESAPMSPLRRYLSMLRTEAQDIRAILVFAVFVGFLSLTIPLAVEAVVNTIAFGRYFQPLVVLCLIVSVFLGFRSGLRILMTIVSEIIQRKLFVRTVEDLSYRLTQVPLSNWKKQHGPELVNRFFDIVNVQKITSNLLLETLMLGLQTIIGLTVLAFYHPFLLGYDVGLLAMMAIILYFMGKGAIKTAVKESTRKYETAAWLQEIVRHPSTFKFNGGLGYAINRADELAAKYIHQRQDHFRILIRQVSFALIMQVFAATVLLALGGYLVIIGQMNLGQLVAAELIVTAILSSFAKLGKDLESFYDLMASVEKLGLLFDLPVENYDKLQLARRPGAYELALVDIQLDSRSGGAAKIEFAPGNTYAIVGASELYRSKLIEVMVGQLKPVSGYVSLNGYRVDAIAAESLQEKISLIRDIELFEASVDDHLRMGRRDIGSSEVNEIVERLGLFETLAALPGGFERELIICG